MHDKATLGGNPLEKFSFCFPVNLGLGQHRDLYVYKLNYFDFAIPPVT